MNSILGENCLLAKKTKSLIFLLNTDLHVVMDNKMEFLVMGVI